MTVLYQLASADGALIMRVDVGATFSLYHGVGRSGAPLLNLGNVYCQAYLAWVYGEEAFALIVSKGPTASLAGLIYANTPVAYIAPPAPPATCQLWQLQAAMTSAQWTAAQNAVAALNNPAVSAFWAHGTNVIPANSVTLLSLGAAIGLTADQVTTLVAAASQIVIP
jgi:hypothetical protein